MVHDEMERFPCLTNPAASGITRVERRKERNGSAGGGGEDQRITNLKDQISTLSVPNIPPRHRSHTMMWPPSTPRAGAYLHRSARLQWKYINSRTCLVFEIVDL